MKHRQARTILSLALLVAIGDVPAAAQSSLVFTPSVAVAAFYDENVIWRPQAQSDHVWRVTPAIDLTRRSVRSRMRVDGLVDGEWYSRFRTLSTIGARQHAGLLWDFRATDVGTLGLSAGYDNSINSSQINLGTGLLIGRIRAWRWFTAPQYTHAVTGRTSLETIYKLTGEFAARPEGVIAQGPGMLSHSGEFAVVTQAGPRDELRPSYTAELFTFRTGEHVPSHKGMLRWTHRLTPSVRGMLGGGTRIAADRVTPEVEMTLSRRAGWTESMAGYTWTRTTALGISDLVEVHHLLASLGYNKPQGVGAGLSGGFYRSGVGEDRAEVYRVAADFSVPVFRPLTLVFAGSVDYQRGRLGIPLVPEFQLLPEAPTDPQFLVAPNGPIRRSTFIVSFVLSGTKQSASGPSERPPQPNDPFSERRRR